MFRARDKVEMGNSGLRKERHENARSAWLGFFLLTRPFTLQPEDLFDIKPLFADGVYAAISKPAYKVNARRGIIFVR